MFRTIKNFFKTLPQNENEGVRRPDEEILGQYAIQNKLYNVLSIELENYVFVKTKRVDLYQDASYQAILPDLGRAIIKAVYKKGLLNEYILIYILDNGSYAEAILVDAEKHKKGGKIYNAV